MVPHCHRIYPPIRTPRPRNPRPNPTPCSVRHPAGASSPTTSPTTTPRRPSSNAPDEDPLSISSSYRFSHPVLHLQGAAPMFPSSFAPPPFPHHCVHLHHRKRIIIITISSMKLRPNRRHQRGCTLIAAFSSRFDLTVLPALGPKPTRHGSIHGGVAGHFLHGVAPSAATSTSVGVAAALALARAAALLLLSVPCLVFSCYCSCSRCCSCSCSCLQCCYDLATLQSTESTFGSVDF